METFDIIFKNFKRKLSTKKMILRFISRKSRLMIISLIILTIILGEVQSHTNYSWFWILIAVVAFYTFWYVNKLVLKVRSEKYGTREHFQEMRYVYLLDILKSNNIYDENDLQKTRDQFNTLINILNNKLNKRKISARFYSFMGTLIVITTKGNSVINFIKTKAGSLPNDTINLTIVLCIQLFGLLLALLPLIFEILDRNHEKMHEMRNMLYEVLLKRL